MFLDFHFRRLFLHALVSLIGALFLFHRQAHAQDEVSKEMQQFIEAKTRMGQTFSEDQDSQFEKVRNQALREKKTLVLVFSALWCGYCPSLLAQTKAVLETRPELSKRYLLHPVVMQNDRKTNGKWDIQDSVSGQNVLRKIFEPILEGTQISLDQVIRGWPLVVMLDPSSSTSLKQVETDIFELPQEKWVDGKYHSPVKISQFLKTFDFTFKGSCQQFFKKQ